MSSPPLGDGASAQEDGDEEASSSPSSDDGTQHSHSEATAENGDTGSDVVTDDGDDDDDDDGAADSDAQSKTDLRSDDDELQENADDEQNSLQSGDDESVSENSEDQRSQPTKSAGAEGTSSSSLVKLGGPNGSDGIPAYALLVGMMDPDVSDSQETISIPITRIPTTLGKEHSTKDPSFVGLKELSSDNNSDPAVESAPKLSQSMCCIFYRDAHGGKLGLYKKGRKKDNDNTGDEQGEIGVDPLDGMIYKPCENNIIDVENEKTNSASSSPDDVLRLPGMDSNAPLPTSGFFAIECTGRKIIVGGKAVKKGQVAMLKDGMPIKIASHCLYFLLPKSQTSASSSKLPLSIKVKLAMTQQIKHEKVSSSTLAEKNDREGNDGGGNLEQDNSTSSPPPPPAKKPRKSEEFHVSSFDDKSDAQLLHLLSQKVKETSWDHEGQKLGSTLATRVCRAAARSAQIQSIVHDEGGVTQREIIDWMNNPSNVFRDYERMMLGKIVEKSFMMSMGKAIVRAGYTKNEYLSGRAFRWNLPEDIPLLGRSDLEKEGLELGPPSMSGVNDLEEGGLTAPGNDIKEEDLGSNASDQSRRDGEGDGECMNLSDEESEKESLDVITSSNF